MAVETVRRMRTRVRGADVRPEVVGMVGVLSLVRCVSLADW